MSELYWMIPVGILMVWGLIGFFRGGGSPSDDKGSDKANAQSFGPSGDP